MLVVGLAVAVSAYEPIDNDYHNTIGVYEAARIKQAEESADFDGSRITGGNFASLGQFPYQAGLVIALVDGRQSVCGASLISNTRLVTGCSLLGYHYRASSSIHRCSLAQSSFIPGGTRIQHQQCPPAPKLQYITLGILVSLVEATNMLDLGRLHLDSVVMLTVLVFLQASDTLNLQVITNDVCRRTYGSIILASNICVATPNGRSTCGGDSGGPPGY
ncbi:unnamed protein product [Danaus chrysippus]|uniref:(African queen) hypothetical protein n=1 Tax=Danaus chrysippus TaxID=151541 RepID=A0A8J2QKU1_9NEOP|nr:unnamed protein product [Danaus chrysippus]